MKKSTHSNCGGHQCGCPAQTAAPSSKVDSSLGRRDFLKALGAGAAAALAFHPWQSAMAGPFTRADFQKLVPEDKKLSPDWVKSLTARGERTIYRGAELASIGMPIGGICAGQLYLGGDGRLWHWDIFNRRVGTGAEHYAKPMKTASPIEQGFALRVTINGGAQERPMDAAHWKDISFIGEYPIGYVSYTDPECPVGVELEAFSPFIPLNVEDSSLPATILEFTLKNTSAGDVDAELGGWLENGVCLHSAQKRDGIRRNRISRDGSLLFLNCSAEEPPPGPKTQRPEIVFDDFEREGYGDWTASGTAFGKGPVEAAKMPAYQGDVGAKGKRLVNTHAGPPGGTVEQRDAATGRLTSKEFTVERNYITFLVGGGNHKGRTCMNLLVNGDVVRSTTGAADNRLQTATWDVRQWSGLKARIEIVDEEKGAWGNIGIDDIVFSDSPRAPLGPLAEEEDFGTMGLALLNPQREDIGSTSLSIDQAPAAMFANAASAEPVNRPFNEKLVGALVRTLHLRAGEVKKVIFVLTWHFPQVRMGRLPDGRSYGVRFKSASDVAAYVSANYSQLSAKTHLWHDTWYDSTLPYWFLDRTFLNTSILASSSCYRFSDGRFYSWEGVGCCEGTCGHVWQYAHAVARLFPEFERSLREKVDFGLALQPSGAIHFRGEFNDIPAIDAQAGSILRTCREHQMSADGAFLKRVWPQVKKAVDWLIEKDANSDGLIESNQHNTLDTDWFGPVAWLSGLYLAALRAAEVLAQEMGDKDFAAKCSRIFEEGRKNLVSQLFDGEYFINKVDSKHLDAINSGTGCEIDQVMGQSWAYQVGLPRVVPEKETQSALRSLWRYNFTPDVGPYRDNYKAGRWYAMPGEAGLLMCTFPRSDWDYAQAKGKGPEWAAGYFNECMNGFEYQAAGHMIWEGMLTEGLAVTRAVHDRYHASRRNPFNEIECGDHYVRSMASYGVFLAVCGYEYHGPRGHLAFAPRLTPEKFKAPFTVAVGWGTYEQAQTAQQQGHRLELKHGELRLKTVSVELAAGAKLTGVKARVDRKAVPAKATQKGSRVEVSFGGELKLKEGAVLEWECLLA